MAPTGLLPWAADQGFLSHVNRCRSTCVAAIFFVTYSEFIHAGEAVPLSLPCKSLRKVGFLGLATFPVTYQFTQGIHVPLWAFEKQAPVPTKPRCAMVKWCKTPTEKCFTCNTRPLCKDHAAGLCLACETLQPQQAQRDTLTPHQQIRLDYGITCYMPVDTTLLYLLLHPLPEQPPSPFRADLPVPTVKVAECLVREQVHEAEHLPPANDTKFTLLACQPGAIVAMRQPFGGIATGPGGGEQALVWQWDMPSVDTPILEPNTALACRWFAQSWKEGVYVCRCVQVCQCAQTCTPHCFICSQDLCREPCCCRSGSVMRMSTLVGVDDQELRNVDADWGWRPRTVGILHFPPGLLTLAAPSSFLAGHSGPLAPRFTTR